MAVFTVEDRRRRQDELIERARSDGSVVAAALVGSTATGDQDPWSDIDLALRLAAGADADAVAADWTAVMYERYAVVDHLDVWRSATRYRVFVLADSLQVDVSFWPVDEFRATGPRFALVFGDAAAAPVAGGLSVATTSGWGWLYALHARSAIARRRVWQAAYMISGLRYQVVALACLRLGLPAADARGADDLPAPVRDRLARTLVVSLEVDDLLVAFGAACDALADELRYLDDGRADLLVPVLAELVRSAGAHDRP